MAHPDELAIAIEQLKRDMRAILAQYPDRAATNILYAAFAATASPTESPVTRKSKIAGENRGTTGDIE